MPTTGLGILQVYTHLILTIPLLDRHSNLISHTEKVGVRDLKSLVKSLLANK